MAENHVFLYCAERSMSGSVAMPPQVWKIRCWCEQCACASGSDSGGAIVAVAHPTKATLFSIILSISGNSHRDIRSFFCPLFCRSSIVKQSRRHGGLWWAYPTQTKLQAPQNWIVKKYKLVEFLAIFRMSSHLHKRKAPTQDCKAPLLKTFWRRFYCEVAYTSSLL